MEVVKGQGKQQKVVKHTVAYPTGYHSLPVKGGLLDQPYRLMEFFTAFLGAERRTAYKLLSK
jgi:hypothetical protein